MTLLDESYEEVEMLLSQFGLSAAQVALGEKVILYTDGEAIVECTVIPNSF